MIKIVNWCVGWVDITYRQECYFAQYYNAKLVEEKLTANDSKRC